MVVGFTQAYRPMAVATPLGPDELLLTGFAGREALSQLFEFRLGLVAGRRTAVAFEKLLGQPVAVRLALGDGEQRHFHGIVSRFSQGQRDEEFTRYSAHMVPRAWLLTRRTQSRVFQQKSVPAILKEVFAGLDVDLRGIRGEFHPRDYCVQYRETDWAFASRLMEEEGIWYYFHHSADGHTLVLANTPDAHPEIPGNATVQYDETEGGARDGYRVTEWEKAQELRPGKVSLRDHTFEIPRNRLEAIRPTLAAVAAGKVTHPLQVGGNQALEMYDYPGDYAGRFDGVDPAGGQRPADLQKIFDDNQRTAGIRMEQEAAPGLVIRGAGNSQAFAAGHRFELERHFDADGPYVLTSVEHDAEMSNNFRSGGTPQFDYANRFTCIPFALPYRPQRVTPRPRVAGAQTAVVVGAAPDEIFCDKYGRVKVQFHWDRHGKSDAKSSCWVRVATPWAGQKWGMVHIPRVGQEVVVDFLEGNPDEPIIVGSVYNADHMPPFDLPKGKAVSGVKSNSTPGGGGYNAFTFDDTKGKEQVVTHAQHDMTTTVLHDQALTVKNDRKTTVEGTFTETITKDTKITIKEGKYEHTVAKGVATYHVEGDLTETYNGGQTTTVHKGIVITSSKDKVHVTAATEIKLTCGASSLLLKKDGTILLQGKMVTSKATGTHEILGGLVKIN